MEYGGEEWKGGTEVRHTSCRFLGHYCTAGGWGLRSMEDVTHDDGGSVLITLETSGEEGLLGVGKDNDGVQKGVCERKKEFRIMRG